MFVNVAKVFRNNLDDYLRTAKMNDGYQSSPRSNTTGIPDENLLGSHDIVEPNNWLLMTNTSVESPQLNKFRTLSSSQNMGWKGILVEQYQSQPHQSLEGSFAALSVHWLNFYLTKPFHLVQKHDDRFHESIIQNGDLVFVPAGQPTYWRSQSDRTPISKLSVCLQPELVTQIAESSDLNPDRIELIDCFSRSDLHLRQIAVMLLAEIQSGGIMGELYVESLTQVFVIHLLRHYSSLQPKIANRYDLPARRLENAIDYIQAHLDSDLSMAQIAGSVNSSPTYFASLFKQATGISLHQYVIKQRVERAKLLIETTDLPIFNIAAQVGFASSSHLTYHCKRLTGMTPKQIANRII
jgi:AraC family transcriptional regulator